MNIFTQHIDYGLEYVAYRKCLNTVCFYVSTG